MGGCSKFLFSVVSDLVVAAVSYAPSMVATSLALEQHARFLIDSRWTLPGFEGAINDVKNYSINYDYACKFSANGRDIYYENSDQQVFLNPYQCHVNADANQFKPAPCDVLGDACTFNQSFIPFVLVGMVLISQFPYTCVNDGDARAIERTKIMCLMFFSCFLVCGFNLIEWFNEPDTECLEDYCDILPGKDSDFIIAATCGYCLSVLFNGKLNLDSLPKADVLPATAIDKFDSLFWGALSWAVVASLSTVLVRVGCTSGVKAAMRHCTTAVGSLWRRATTAESKPLLADGVEMNQTLHSQSLGV